jgi:broad specificity phosphatase PhoE
MIRPLLAAVILVFTAVSASAQGAVFVVRHAERADAGTASGSTMAADPDLSEAGRARAQSLASMLKDTRITAIYVTEFKRTQQTAEPLAKALGITPTIVPARDSAALGEKLKSTAGNVLVVGHSNTVGAAVAAAGGTESIKVGDDEYDNLFVVVRGEKPSVLRLRYR